MILTQEQREAVNCQENLILTACPGSGKTRTISARLIREVEKLRGSSRATACITYTNTAVQTIHERVNIYTQSGDENNFTISTIHSFCLNEILRPFAWLVPSFNGSMKILTRDRVEFEEIVDYTAEQINFPTPIFRDYEAFTSINIDTDRNLVNATNNLVRNGILVFWGRCEELGFIDFPNIIFKSYQLLRDHPIVSSSVAAKYASFLIDEFQDTSELQIEILKLIYDEGRSSIFAVGDYAQSIFGFAGARPELIEPFAGYIAARTDLSLSGNFRSNPQIVAQAERLFPRLPAMTSSGPNRTCLQVPRVIRNKQVFDAITEDFLPWLTELNIDYGEAVILARDWNSLFPISRPLQEYGVPIAGPGARPYRRSRLFATLAEQICGYLVDPITSNIHQLEVALFHAVQDVTSETRLDIFSYSGRVTIVQLLREARNLARVDGAVQWLERMAQAVGIILTRNDFISQAQAGLFFASVQSMKADMHERNVDLNNLRIEDLALFSNPHRSLRLTTIHAAKGREYKAVAIINTLERNLPDLRNEVESEKRLFYVGITRAERALMYICGYNSFGSQPSRFLGAEGVGILT